MKSKHKFTPDQVVPMEERALLSHFPAALGPVTTLHLKGAFVLTSRTYSNLQSQINTVVANFEHSVIRLFNQQGGFTAAFDSAVGTFPPSGTPNPGTLLAKLDAAMGSLEFRVPWGGNSLGAAPTGGLGLSNKTIPTTSNPGVLVDPNTDLNDSVAEAMETAIENQETSTAPTAAALLASMNVVRGEAQGIVPAYVVAFGPQGARDFGLKNS
jgi:hypothetical protein